MGNLANTLSGSKGKLIGIEESCCKASLRCMNELNDAAGMVKVISEASRDKYSGLHIRYDGSQAKW